MKRSLFWIFKTSQSLTKKNLWTPNTGHQSRFWAIKKGSQPWTRKKTANFKSNTPKYAEQSSSKPRHRSLATSRRSKWSKSGNATTRRRSWDCASTLGWCSLWVTKTFPDDVLKLLMGEMRAFLAIWRLRTRCSRFINRGKRRSSFTGQEALLISCTKMAQSV